MLAAACLLFIGFAAGYSFVIAFALAVLLPGFIISRILLPPQLPLSVLLVSTAGAGIAAAPLFTYLLRILSIPLNAWTLGGIIILLAAGAARMQKKRLLRINSSAKDLGTATVLLLFLLASLVLQLLPVRGLDVPPFADPALQGSIIRMMEEQEGIPRTWESLSLPLEFRHQPGFASLGAWISILSSAPIPRIVFLLTNTINALLPLFLFFFAAVLLRSRTAGIIAALLGLLAMFPSALFVAGANATIASYPLILFAGGLLIVFLRRVQKQKKPGFALSHKELLLLFLVAGGMMLIHPVSAVFLLIVSSPFGIIAALIPLRRIPGRLPGLLSLALPVAVAAALVIPFYSSSAPDKGLLETQWEYQADYVNPEQVISPWLLVEPAFFLFDNPKGSWFLYLEDMGLQGLLDRRVGLLTAAFLILGMGAAIRSKRPGPRSALALFLLFLLLSWGQSALRIPFPGSEALYPSRIKFFLILPVSLLIASLVTARWRIPRPQASLALILSLLVIAPASVPMVWNHLSGLAKLAPFSSGDRNAIAWIASNVPEDALILNTVRDIESGVFIGGAGQWIPAITGHSVFFPALSLTEDVSSQPIASRPSLMRGMEAGLASRQSFSGILQARGITHVFLSPSFMHSRRVLFDPASSRQFLIAPDRFHLEFEEDGTYVFSLLPASQASPDEPR